MALAERIPRRQPKGRDKPRIAPPVPARHDLAAFRQTAADMGITLMPFQETVGKYLTAKGPGDSLLYREVCVVVARQNGKTTLMKPFIVGALRAGRKVLHIAQIRELPRHMFEVIADAMSKEPELFPKRRGRTIWPRHGAGQEEITLLNGGWYRIAAASPGGGRGLDTDIVIIDELREMDSEDVMDAVGPTNLMSRYPQTIYLSNAGHTNSVVLNAIRDRRDDDPSLAYLEWSAAPERATDDIDGWAEANPALGHFPAVLDTLEAAHRRHKLAGTMARFETEHLCRWVTTMREPLIDPFLWESCEREMLDPERRPFLAVSMDPDGRRASAVLAWRQSDETIAVRSLLEAVGDPIDTDALGRDLRKETMKRGIPLVGFDPATDKALALHFPKAKSVSGQDYLNASARFVTAVAAGKVRWHDADAVTADLEFTARKPHDAPGTFEAVRADETRPVTAALAAVRAVWLASELKLSPPKVL